MTDNQRFAKLLAEFRRVGVDPDTFSAVIDVPADAALRALADLADDAGPAAFLARLRLDRESDDDLAGAPGTPDAPNHTR